MAGRKRKAGVRTPSGRLSRAKAKRSGAARSVRIEARVHADDVIGVAARMRQHELSEAEARDQRAATVLGRLRLVGARGERGSRLSAGLSEWLCAAGISERMHHAGTEVLARYEAFQRAIKAPGLRPQGRTEAGDATTADYAAWCGAATFRWDVIGYVVQGANASMIGRRLTCWAALDLIVLRDEAHPHLDADLKVALEAVADYLDWPEPVEAAFRAWKRGLTESAPAALECA